MRRSPSSVTGADVGAVEWRWAITESKEEGASIRMVNVVQVLDRGRAASSRPPTPLAAERAHRQRPGASSRAAGSYTPVHARAGNSLPQPDPGHRFSKLTPPPSHQAQVIASYLHTPTHIHPRFSLYESRFHWPA
ncbi:hypothetical protein L1887_48316 [Cichorium endivia]|nr:hypothetical protein L1887_48316 [Cichorium endivia]